MLRLKLRRRIRSRVHVLRRLIARIWDRILTCSSGKPRIYQMLPRNNILSFPMPQPAISASHGSELSCGSAVRQSHDKDSDLVDLKVSLLGDGQIGKTSFLVKYVGNESVFQRGEQTRGLNVMDKTFLVGGARISYNIWEVEGDEYSNDHIPLACKDSVAILIMFDLTSRCTLNSVLRWFQRARIHNQKAIPILVGTKFEEFIQLPIDMQWTIASQARAYAKALKATLFFSSATYNINVNKIFKFITAKLFDLPWTLERNLTIGEPIIDF